MVSFNYIYAIFCISGQTEKNEDNSNIYLRMEGVEPLFKRGTEDMVVIFRSLSHSKDIIQKLCIYI